MPARRPSAYFVVAGVGALAGGLLVLRLGGAVASGLGAPTREAALERKVAGLEAEVGLLERKLEAAEARGGPAAGPLGPPSDEADLAARAALAGIELPPKSTREQVVEYVRRIMRVARSQNHFGSSDPHIDMLASVGPAHLDVLIAEGGDDSFYVPYAVAKVAGEDQKAQVTAALKRHPGLIAVVRKRGWEADAKQVLVERLRQGPTDVGYFNLPTEWIQAVASFRDPETYPLLRGYLVRGGNPHWTYQAVADLDVDLDEWVAYAWARRRMEVRGLGAIVGLGDHWSDFETVAVLHGHPDALDRLFKALRGTGGTDDWRRDSARRAVTAVTDAAGTDPELVAWYDRHKAGLTWDAKRRKYIPAAAGAATARATNPAH